MMDYIRKHGIDAVMKLQDFCLDVELGSREAGIYEISDNLKVEIYDTGHWSYIN